jgi:hypothetical protein
VAKTGRGCLAVGTAFRSKEGERMNALVLILMTSCPVAGDPVPAGAACACSQNTGSWNSTPLASRPRLLGRLRGWFHRSPTGDGYAGGVPMSMPASAPVVQTSSASGAVQPATTRFPTTAEPPLASGTSTPGLAAFSR